MSGRDRVLVRRREWAGLDEDEVRRVDAVWAEAFPPSERGERDTVATRSSDLLWTAHLGGELLGFATGVRLPESGALYLEYLAVSASSRGSGTGGALLEAVAEDVLGDPGVTGIVLEVEDPARTPGDLAARRIGFYERWGARVVTAISGYEMPDLAEHGQRVPMVLLWRGGVAQPVLEADGVVLVLRDLYLGYYAHAAEAGHLAEMVGLVDRPA
ncbi:MULTISPECIES: GNAT family N-acetyltransferase [Actinosynnema]|uniref:GNAT family N-acetyltransferase n=1 Tax=Actinosynnema TaxID=40566 RepID=UPI0020A536A7|nr:GNAT family N-acetyltransferase [Actinosynnema pretiosum]MCP2096618.1 Acetyltransferase (GNAT) family protein [Actinosynnema pretiosum]